MNRYAYVVLCGLLIIGCGKETPHSTSLASVNDFSISKEQFEAEFKDSALSRVDTIDARKEFLETLIERKLILQDAGRMGLDKEASFLKTVEKFWEQSLLKITLDKKMEEIAASITVTEEEIQNAFNAQRTGSFQGTFDEMKFKLKNDLMRTKQAEAVNAWLSDMRNKARIAINEEMLQS